MSKKSTAASAEVTTYEAGEDNVSKLEKCAAEAKARIERGDKAQAQAENHYISAGLFLKEAKARCKAEKIAFLPWLKENGIGKTKAYEVLAIADGRKTEKEAKEANAERQAKHRAKNKKARNAAEDAMEDGDEDDGLTSVQREFLEAVQIWVKTTDDKVIQQFARRMGFNI